ncbi:polysaccharide deacetylase family protein [Aromatoleum petrolei]|uniref:Polysaccharide deacetylase family protein n=1 Tax=Aromatoleum petrolei TaxID=76116 RepID=A0ABX1MLL7_9RHOO|nr:polysaccharide deacetylase family protein [Aromatoleum petrolei]NMF88030.1 polysaccharide deacetylase family protein [Aromatoleum petrolei]QTQ38811.1 Polysaccharide deacetylase family protein [Aromatoleum petrolei]
MPRPWRPGTLIGFSAALHAAAAAGIALRPDAWPWAAAAVAANHGALTAAGLLPRCSLLGTNWTRLPAAAVARREIALTIDDGPDPQVTPYVLDLLDAQGARANFFVIGRLVREHPALAREIVARGHAVENHSENHVKTFSLRGPRWLAREIGAAQDTIADICGRTPRFFRAPAGLRNPFLEPVLARLDLQLASWTRRAYDTRTGDPAIVCRRLSENLGAGDILLLHDGNAARTGTGAPVILDVLPRLLERFARDGLEPVTLASAIP